MFSITRLTSKLLLAGLAILTISLIAACASDDETATDQPAANSESQAESNAGSSIVSTDAAVPVPTATVGPPEVAVTPKEQPVPGSEEEAVLNVLERQVRSLNNSDWDGFMELCNPKFLNPPTPKEVKYIWEELGGDFGFFIPGFTTEGYNARNVVIKFPSESIAVTNYEMWDYDELVTIEVSRAWEKIDGVWYQDGGYSCTQDRIIKDEFRK